MPNSALYLQTPLGLDPSKNLFDEFFDLLITYLKDQKKKTPIKAILCQSLDLVQALSNVLKDIENAPSLVLNANLLDGESENIVSYDALHFLHNDAFNLYKTIIQKNNKPNHEYGVGPLGDKDEIINAGEMDADYVAIPASNHDLIDWASTFTTLPVVMWGAQDIEMVKKYLKTDIGFVMPAPWFWKDLETNFNALD